MLKAAVKGRDANRAELSCGEAPSPGVRGQEEFRCGSEGSLDGTGPGSRRPRRHDAASEGKEGRSGRSR